MLPVGLTRRGLWLMPLVGGHLLWRNRPAIRSLKPLNRAPGMSVRIAHLISPLWLDCPLGHSALPAEKSLAACESALSITLDEKVIT